MNKLTQAAQVAARRERALELKRVGFTLAQIGRELGVSKQSVSRYIHAALTDSVKRQEKDADCLRELELERLDALQRACERILAKKGHELAAADRLLRIAESRRKLLGIDAPEKTEGDNELRITVIYED